MYSMKIYNVHDFRRNNHGIEFFDHGKNNFWMYIVQ